MLAVAAAAGGAFEVSVDVVLFWAPAEIAATLTLIVQVELAATVPPVKVTEPLPATAVRVPPQVLVRPFGVATMSPKGSRSVNARPVNATGLGFTTVNVKVVVPLRGTVGELNAFENVGAPGCGVLPAGSTTHSKTKLIQMTEFLLKYIGTSSKPFITTYFQTC
jgi:hypothetical protein